MELLKHHAEIAGYIQTLMHACGLDYATAKRILINRSDHPYYGNSTERACFLNTLVDVWDRIYQNKESVKTLPDNMRNRRKDPICNACIHINEPDCSARS